MNAFKGCIGSIEAGEAVARGIRKHSSVAEVKVIGLADGGDGTLSVIRKLIPNAKLMAADVLNALLEPSHSSWLYDNASRTAFLEMARSAGIALLRGRRDVMHASSFGFGMQISQAIDAGARHITMGLGGSATNDAGLGAMQALGLRVRLRGNGWLTRPVTGSDLAYISELDAMPLLERIKGITFTALFDAHIPFRGPTGAARLYAPQKGASPAMVEQLERGLRNVEPIMCSLGQLPSDTEAEGAGAAGGTGLACRCLLGATMLPGARYLLELQRLPALAANADGIITGEGSSDEQTLQGKGPETVKRMTPPHIPVYLLSGHIEDLKMLLDAGFSRAVCINDNAPDPQSDPLLPEVALRRLEAAASALMEQGVFGADRDNA